MKGAWPNNFGKGVVLGGLAALLICLLMGAVHNDGPTLTVPVLNPHEDSAVPLSSTGRYQIVTWEAGGSYGAFVLDTSTGTTKVAYSSSKGPSGKSVNNLGKPFQQM
jgi:hypothetical protein